MTYKLQDYPPDLLDRIKSAWFAGTRSIICQLSTGCGKTILFSTPIDRLMESPTKPPLEIWQYLEKKLGYHPTFR